jgi:hypothetical protein
VRDIRNPQHDPVRADGLQDDPAGGVLDGAPDVHLLSLPSDHDHANLVQEKRTTTVA